MASSEPGEVQFVSDRFEPTQPVRDDVGELTGEIEVLEARYRALAEEPSYFAAEEPEGDLPDFGVRLLDEADARHLVRAGVMQLTPTDVVLASEEDVERNWGFYQSASNLMVERDDEGSILATASWSYTETHERGIHREQVNRLVLYDAEGRPQTIYMRAGKGNGRSGRTQHLLTLHYDEAGRVDKVESRTLAKRFDFEKGSGTKLEAWARTFSPV